MHNAPAGTAALWGESRGEPCAHAAASSPPPGAARRADLLQQPRCGADGEEGLRGLHRNVPRRSRDVAETGLVAQRAESVEWLRSPIAPASALPLDCPPSPTPAVRPPRARPRVACSPQPVRACARRCKTGIEKGREAKADYKLIARSFMRIGNAYKKQGAPPARRPPPYCRRALPPPLRGGRTASPGARARCVCCAWRLSCQRVLRCC